MTIKGKGGEQLKMFMTAGELKAVRPNDFVRPGASRGSTSEERGWEQKLRVSTWKSGKTESLHSSIEREGVIDPVYLVHGEDTALVNGHHRVAAAIDTRGEDTLIPVVHFSKDANEPFPLRSDPRRVQ